MKKVLTLLLIVSAAILSPQISMASANSGETTSRVEYNSTASTLVPQRRNRGRGRGRDNYNRTRFITRVVRQGRHVYRITYRVTYANGRTYTSVVRRERIR